MTFNIQVVGSVHRTESAKYKVECKSLEEARKKAADRFKRDYGYFWDAVVAVQVSESKGGVCL